FGVGFQTSCWSTGLSTPVGSIRSRSTSQSSSARLFDPTTFHRSRSWHKGFSASSGATRASLGLSNGDSHARTSELCCASSTTPCWRHDRQYVSELLNQGTKRGTRH